MKTSLIVLLILIIILLIVLFIFYGSKLLSILGGNLNNTNGPEKKNTSNGVAMALVELKDAEQELVALQELAQNQEQAAKIEILLGKVNFYKTEFQKPKQENVKQIIEDFYNSGLWQGIAELKNKLENANQNSNYVPELE